MDNTLVQEVYTRNGRTRYYTDSANEVFNSDTAEQKKADFSFLSAENIGKSIAEKQKANDDFKERYLIELDDTQRGLLNVMLEHSDDPEEQVYKFATAQKYAEHFNIPFNFAYENLDDINRNWLGVGIEAHKGNFRAVADSFEIGVNTLRMSKAGRDLMAAEESGDETDIQAALEYLKTLEGESAQLQDKIPRNWLVNLLKLGANTVPYSAAVLAPSLAASAVNPLFGTAVGFGVSAELQTGLEYWELRKAGVQKDLAKNIALVSGGLQAVVETALGSVAGATGRGLGADKITSKLLTRLNAKGVFGKLGKSLLFYGANIAEEGFEEAVQNLISAGSKELAAVLQGEGVETDTAIEIAESTWESFKGGIAGSLVLGVPGAIKYGRLNVQEAKVLQKAAIITPSETAFINENKDSIVFEGMSEEDTEQELHNIFEAQKNAREKFQKSKINDYDQWLSADTRIEGEAVIDDEGNTVYETDDNGNVILETDEEGQVHKKVKRYEAQADVVRHKDRLYISEGKRTEYASGIVKGEYIAGDPTRETDDNDYGHIYYTYNPDSNTVRITKLEMMSNRYDGIIKEFVRDFGEKFAGSRIKWDVKGETLQKIKEELIAENPRGKESGLQYFTDDISSDAERSRIKLHDKLKEYMPNLNETERHMAVALFEALAQGAGMDIHSYLDTYYETAVFTKTAPEGMAQLAAQQDIDTQTIKGATDFKGLEGDIKALVYVSEKSDFSTLVHEAAHVARRTMQGALLQQAEKAFGVTDGIWTREAEERFAKGFEQYLREGKAPSTELKNIFQKAAEFLSRIYKSLKELVHINDDIRAVYDELLGVQGSALQQAQQSIQEAERAKKAKQNTSGKYASAESYEQNKVIETAEDKALDNAALKDKYMVYAKERFQGNSYHNIDTDTDIRVSRDILGEWKSKTKSREQILSMQILDKLIESAVETNTVDDKKNRRNIGSIKYFETGLTVNDNTHKAHLTARKIQDNTTKAYHYYLEDISLEDMVLDRIKEEAALRANASSKEVNVPLLHGPVTDTIAQQDEAVNSEKTVYEQAQDAYDKASKAVQEMKPLSNEELKDMLFQTGHTEKETQETEAVRAQYEGTDKWLKAPNGKDTQLSEKQWVQVRTDSFKKWFGDWENDPENASKVIDENGEPLVVYHGTAHTFNTFSTPLNMERIFLTRNKEFAGKYGNIAMPLFVNAKDVLSVDYKGKDAFDDITIQGKKLESIEEAAEYARENGYNALFAAHVADSGTFSSEIDINDEVIVFNPNQIKSAVDNKGTFDSANDNIYFQTEADFYEESTQAINKEVLEHDVEKIVLGKDPMEFYSLIYSDSEQRALYDKAFREAISEDLEEALQKDIKDESVKNDTFMKMLLHNKDALKEFLKQFIAAESAAHDHLMPHDAFIAHGGRFGELAYEITQGKSFTEKQYKRALGIIEDDVGTYRNIFARLNGYEALKSMSKEEKAWTKAYSEAVFSGKVKNAEVQSAERFRARNRSETQDALFLAEMDDDAKFNAFLQRAAQIYFFNFDAFQAQDAEDARERDRIQAQKERIDTLMRNMAWKSQLINSYHGKELSAHAVKNIRGQLNNAARTYRDLYADIMDRRDMRVKDADSTDEIIKTKLRSRKQSSVVLDELKLENMSAKEKEVLIQALDNEETEENIRKGFITLTDVEKIENLIKAKNKNIKSLEARIKDLKEDEADSVRIIAKLEKDIRDERTARRVLSDTVRARDAALKAVMKRINLKACNVDEAQSIASVQWYLRTNVQKALNATVDKAEPVIREAYTLWQISPEYREKLARMLGRKKGWGELRALLNNEHKAVADWSSDDRKLAMRLIPGRSKFYSLGLDARTEKNFLDMKTAAMGTKEIARQATEVLGETLIARLKHRPLKQWTVDELIELAQRIDEVYQAGRKKYVAKKAALQAEAEAIRIAGIQAFRGAKDWRGKDIFKEIPGAWSEDEKKKTGGIPALLRTAKYTAMRSYAFMEMLDGGRQGTLYDLFEYEQRECNALFKQNTNKRIDAFYEFLQKNKLDLSELDKTVVFDDFYRDINDPFAKGKSLTLTAKEVLGAYLASFDEKSRAAVQYGNFAEQKERDFAQKGDGETSLDVLSEERLHRVFWKAEELLSQDERLRGLVQLLQKEYKEEGRRLQQHDREVNNKITEIREHYFPMQRLDVSGEEDARQTQKKIQGEFATGTRHGVSKGQTKERIDISNKHQKPIKLDIISTYLHSVEANERLFAYDKYAQKLNRVVKGYGSERFVKDLETTYGREAVSYLNKQVNTIIDPTAGRVYSSTDKVIRMLRGNKAAAYLGFKLSSIIKQGITSPAPFMQYVNPVNYTKAAIDWTIHHDEMKKFVYERSMLMKNRSFDMMQAITDELAKNAKTKAGKAITKAQRLGMGGLEWIDRTCVAPGWIAAYRKEKARLEKRNAELSKPLSDNEIDIQSSRYADDVLVRTQPSGRAEELAPLFREGGEALRMLLQFQSSLNVIYNNIRHDLPNAIRNKQYGRAAGIITGYALAGLMVGAITEGFSGDDDDEASDKVRRGIYYAFTQYTDSVPIISGIVDSVAEKVITGKTRYRGTSSIFAAAEKLAQGTAALSDADIAKAAQRYAEAAGLTLGLPTSGTKEALYAAEQIFSGEVPSALWGRR